MEVLWWVFWPQLVCGYLRVLVTVDQCLASWEDEDLSSSLPLGHGGQYLYVRNWPKSYHNFVNLHCRGLLGGPGPSEVCKMRRRQKENLRKEHTWKKTFSWKSSEKIQSGCSTMWKEIQVLQKEIQVWRKKIADKIETSRLNFHDNNRLTHETISWCNRTVSVAHSAIVVKLTHDGNSQWKGSHFQNKIMVLWSFDGPLPPVQESSLLPMTEILA